MPLASAKVLLRNDFLPPPVQLSGEEPMAAGGWRNFGNETELGV